MQKHRGTSARPSDRSRGSGRAGDERGAVLVHTAIALVALIAFNGLVVDYGILWLARRQAQNAADAGAMAGAISLAFVDWDDKPAAKLAAVDASNQNFVWGETADITTNDVYVPYVCPPGSPGGKLDPPSDACIRVDVFRNQGRKPLPTIFGTLFNVMEQGVKATATAQVVPALGTECLRPWAIVDRWDEAPENNPDHELDTDWSMDDTFDPTAGDIYVPPGDDHSTGFLMPEDYGVQFLINDTGNADPPSISPGWFRLIDIPRKDTSNTGADALKANILTCGGYTTNYARPDSDIECPDEMNSMGPEELAEWAEVGCYRVQTGVIGAQKNEVDNLIEQDEDAKWDTTLNEIVDSDWDDPLESPRVVPIGVFDIQQYMIDDPNGSHGVVRLVNVYGFFIEGMANVDKDGTINWDKGNGKSIIGRLVTEIGVGADTSGEVDPEDAFLLTIILVR